jgi:hypothetical protein
VMRNHNGVCLAACSELLSEVTSPKLAEALAIRRALTFVREEGFDKIMLASDCPCGLVSRSGRPGHQEGGYLTFILLLSSCSS